MIIRHICVSVCFFLVYSFQYSCGFENVPPSQNPPGGLKPNNVPQLVVVGFDDNSDKNAMQWVVTAFKNKRNPAGTGNTQTFDGTPVRVSFYSNSINFMGTGLEDVHVAAYKDGHEMGNHTYFHAPGDGYTVQQWIDEITKCSQDLASKCGIAQNTIIGFRAPLLHFNDNTYTALTQLGFVYDCSIEEGFQDSMNGTNFLWPYTLDNGSPGNEICVEWQTHLPIGKHPGMWALPEHVFIVPPDDKCQQYGCASGLRKRIKSKIDYFDVNDGKITGLDYNLWVEAGINGSEFSAVLKYSLDLRYNNNRVPFMVGTHSQYYNDAAKQQALMNFVDFALGKPDVRIVPGIRIIEWMRNPVGLIPTFLAKKTAVYPPVSYVKRSTKNDIELAISKPGRYVVSLVLVNGRSILDRIICAQSAGTYTIRYKGADQRSSNMYILSVRSETGIKYYEMVLDCL